MRLATEPAVVGMCSFRSVLLESIAIDKAAECEKPCDAGGRDQTPSEQLELLWACPAVRVPSYE